MIARALLRRRLSKVSDELVRLRGELAIVEQQLVHVLDVAEEAKTRSLVSDDPEAAYDQRSADKDVAATRRDRDAKQARLRKLEAKQDELLDEMVKVMS